MMQSQVIVEQVIITGIIVLTGAAGSWLKVIDEKVKSSISRVVFNISLPLLILTTLTRMEMSGELIANGFWVLIFSVFSLLLMHLAGYFTAKFFRLPQRATVVHELHTMFGNVVFLGFPLIAALYQNEEALFYASVFYMVSSFLQWTYAVFRLKQQTHVSFHDRFSNLLNPNSAAFAIGLFLFFIQWRIPLVIETPLRSIGSITSPLALLYIGASLTGMRLKKFIKRFDLYALSFNKLILIPVVLLLVINLFTGIAGIEFGEMAKTVVVLEAAMPCMSMIVIMARNYGADDESASENVFFTTLLSLLTLPVVYYLVLVM